MPAAATLAALTGTVRDIAVLMVLTLTQSNGGTTTLYLSTRECRAPDGTEYHSGIVDPGVVAQPGQYLGYDVGLCSANPTLAAEAIAIGTTKVRDLYCGDYVWIGSYVTLSVWERTTSEPVQTISGTIQGVEMDGGVLRLSVRQRVDWNAPVAGIAATRERFPNLPDDSVSAALPRRWGRFQNSPCRPPAYPTEYPMSNALERIRGARRAVSGLLVEPGRGSGAATVMFSCHKLHSFGSQAGATSPFILQGDKLDPLVGCTTFNNDDGAGLYLPDDAAVGRCAILPDAYKEHEQYGDMPYENPAALYDPWNDQSYCRIVSPTTAFEYLTFRLGAVPTDVTDGGITSATLLVVARCYALANLGASFVRYSDVHSWGTVIMGPSGSIRDSADFELFTLDVTAFVTGANAGNLGDMGVTFGYHNSGTFGYGWADVAAVALELCYKPKQEKMGSERHVLVTKQRPTARLGKHVIGGGSYQVWDTLPPEQEMRGKFFTNLVGYRDDSAGTYTGTPTTMPPIERPCDIAKHVLRTVGGQLSAQVEDGAGVLGSFTDARALSKTWRGGDMVLASQVDDDTDVMTLLARIAANGLASIQLDPASDKWRYVPWLKDPALTRTRPISRTQFLGTPRVSLSQDSRVAVNFRVPYGYDQATGSYLHEVNVSPSGSNAGWKYLNQNDQSIAATPGVQNKLDFLAGYTADACYYANNVTTVTRTTGNFTTDGFFVGATLWSERPGIQAGTLIQSIAGDGKSMVISKATTAATQPAWGTTLGMLGTATLTFSDNPTMDAWMEALDGALRSTSPTFLRQKWAFAFGGHPRWRTNILWYRDSVTNPPTAGTVRGVTMCPDGADTDMNTMEEIAATLQTNMNNNGSTGWEVTYSRTDKKFTIHNATLYFHLLCGSCNPSDPLQQRYNGSASLGFQPIDQIDDANPTPSLRNHTYRSNIGIEEGQFVLGSDKGFQLRWRNGDNGQLFNTVPKTPFSAFGFSPHDDTPFASTLVSGCVFKGTRQSALASAARRYLRTTQDGPARRPSTIEGKDIYDTDTALEVRNRAADLFSRPHVIVQGSAEGLFGLQRGEVVTFDDDMSVVSRYCAPDSDSLWTGKKFYIIEVQQRQGPDSLAVEFTAVSV